MQRLSLALPLLVAGWKFNNSKCPAPHELQAEGLHERFDLYGNYPGMYYELAFHDILQWACPAVTCVNSNKTIQKFPDGVEYVNEDWGLKCMGKDYPQVLQNNVTDIPGHFEAFVPVTKMPFLPKDLLSNVLFPNTVIDFRPGDDGWTVEFQCVDLPLLGVVYTGINYYSKNTTEEAFQDMDAAAKKAGIDFYTQKKFRRVPQDSCDGDGSLTV